MRILGENDFRTVPWKNGGGVTTDLLMRPPGATHDTFDLRLACAPIASEGPFSSYPNIDRSIVLVRGQRLDLDFGGSTMSLTPLAPQSFDSDLAPHARLPHGPVEVINVMTRRGVWTSSVEVLRGAQTKPLEDRAGEIQFIYVLDGEVRVLDAAPVMVSARQALIVESGSATFEASAELVAVLARISPAGGK